jgi:hypothetical protein
MSTKAETPVAWTLPFTVADQSRIAALDEDTRAAVERYKRDRHPLQQPDPNELRVVRNSLDTLASDTRRAIQKLDRAIEELS